MTNGYTERGKLNGLSVLATQRPFAEFANPFLWKDNENAHKSPWCATRAIRKSAWTGRSTGRERTQPWPERPLKSMSDLLSSLMILARRVRKNLA